MNTIFGIRPLPALLLLALWPAALSAAERRYEIQPGHAQTEVRFRSEATLEDFEGHGNQLSGWLAVDAADLSTLQGEFEFELRSLDTGIGLRNNHMHDNVLHSDDFPVARFVISGCESGALGVDGTKTRVEGTLSLHGASKPTAAEVMALPSGEDIRIEASFDVKLGDFGIKRPKMLVMKVAETVELSIRALARPSAAVAPTDESTQEEDSP